MKPNVLYRFYNSAGQLLYVGITNNPVMRFRDHESKPWWPVVVKITLQYLADRQQLVTAERQAIINEKPLWNIEHNKLTYTSPQRFDYRGPQPDGLCPSCGRTVVYSRAFNLVFHVDGTDNAKCWIQIRRGAVEYTGRVDG